MEMAWLVAAFGLPLLHDCAARPLVLVALLTGRQLYQMFGPLVLVAVVVALAAVSRLLVATGHCQHWARVHQIVRLANHLEVQH